MRLSFSNSLCFSRIDSCLYVIIISCTSFRVNPHSIVCLNVKKLLARSRCHIWSLSGSNTIWTHNHLLHKWTLNHLAKEPVWQNGWMLVYEISCCGFESHCCHLIPVILMNTENVAQWLKHFSLKHWLYIVEC